MYHDKHSAGFVLHHPPRHAKPSGHSAMMRAACAFLAAACLVLSVTVYPASAATSMSSLQNKLDKISASIKQHKTELSDAKKKEAAAKALEALGCKGRVTVVVNDEDVNSFLSFRNLEKVRVIGASESNTYDLLDNGSLVMTKDAVEYVQEVLS